MAKFDIRCPKWALPEEEIPLHVTIEKSTTVKIKDVEISIPNELRLEDTINLDDYEDKLDHITIRNIGKSESSMYDYFGIVVAAKLTESLKRQIPIHIRFNFHDGTYEEYTTYARIFRPLLGVIKCPQKIILTDEKNQNIVIPISLKLTGFGDVRLKCECQIDGKIVSRGTSMMDEIMSRMADAGYTDPPENKDMSVSPQYISQLASYMRKTLGDEGIGEILRKHGQNIRTEAEGMTELERESFMSALYKTLENYVVKILTDILKRNVSSKLQLETQTAIHTQIELPVTKVTIRMHYEDALGNNYTPIEQTIEIVDRRKNSSGLVEIPLEIENVDEADSFKNVGTMNIGAD